MQIMENGRATIVEESLKSRSDKRNLGSKALKISTEEALWLTIRGNNTLDGRLDNKELEQTRVSRLYKKGTVAGIGLGIFAGQKK
jgi:hypothetical protein